MMGKIALFFFFIGFTSAAFLPYPHRAYPIGYDYKFERNCFFSPAQCLLGNFPRSAKLQSVLRVFEDKSLNKIYSNLMRSSNKPAFLGSKK
uniref:Neuropeptide-Like Protein n=2 Tax=Caenorhabditis tropicalis TaxID=1561998 RepID=A0A1I7TNE9_9PELO